LTEADRVHVGSVEKIDTAIERQLEMFFGALHVDVPAFGSESPSGQISAAITHASQAQPGNGDSSLSEAREFHRVLLSRSFIVQRQARKRGSIAGRRLRAAGPLRWKGGRLRHAGLPCRRRQRSRW